MINGLPDVNQLMSMLNNVSQQSESQSHTMQSVFHALIESYALVAASNKELAQAIRELSVEVRRGVKP